MSHNPKHFDEISYSLKHSTIFGKLSFRRNVFSAKSPFVKLSVRQIVRSTKCPSANRPFGKMSFGKLSFGKMSGHLNLDWRFSNHFWQEITTKNQLRTTPVLIWTSDLPHPEVKIRYWVFECLFCACKYRFIVQCSNAHKTRINRDVRTLACQKKCINPKQLDLCLLSSSNHYQKLQPDLLTKAEWHKLCKSPKFMTCHYHVKIVYL